jgi:SAM-dependent methyltransferase
MQLLGRRTAFQPIKRFSQTVDGFARDIKRVFGIESFLDTEDRRVLEEVIFPYFLDDQSFRLILFVGCDWYTRGYNKFFEAQKRYVTIDIDPARRKYGAKQHIVDELQRLDRYFQHGSLDLIICNGVFGWGLNERIDVERAFQACFESLREGGVLILGWDNMEELYPFLPDDSESLALFKPLYFSPLKTNVYETATPYRHTYNFYAKH